MTESEGTFSNFLVENSTVCSTETILAFSNQSQITKNITLKNITFMNIQNCSQITKKKQSFILIQNISNTFMEMIIFTDFTLNQGNCILILFFLNYI